MGEDKTHAVVEMDHKGRVTIPKAARKSLGINDMEEGEKEIINLTVEK